MQELVEEFQFTHPGRGATVEPNNDMIMRAVSIHAPREGCDLLKALALMLTCLFQFTHPGRGATGMLLMRIIPP